MTEGTAGSTGISLALVAQVPSPCRRRPRDACRLHERGHRAFELRGCNGIPTPHPELPRPADCAASLPCLTTRRRRRRRRRAPLQRRCALPAAPGSSASWMGRTTIISIFWAFPSQMTALGAEVQRVRPVSISHPDHFVHVAARAAASAEALATRRGEPGGAGFFADQFENPSNYAAHFEGTGVLPWLGPFPSCLLSPLMLLVATSPPTKAGPEAQVRKSSGRRGALCTLSCAPPALAARWLACPPTSRAVTRRSGRTWRTLRVRGSSTGSPAG